MEKECTTSNVLLSDLVDEYMIINFNDKKTYFANFLHIAGIVWHELFAKSFYTTKRLQVEVHRDQQGLFVFKPKDCTRLFSVSVHDECGLTPLIISDSVPLTVTTLPKGSCRSCDSDLCAVIDSNILLRTEIFDGITYTLKTYIDRLSSGDVIEVSEHLENDSVEDGKVNRVLRRKPLCTLSVYDCGCPQPTIANLEKLKKCGCDCLGYPVCCDNCDTPTVASKYGYFNYEATSNKIRVKPSPNVTLPRMLIIAFQTNGRNSIEELQVPEYAKTTMFDGMKFYASYKDSPNERIANKKLWEKGKLDLAMYLAPFDPVAFRAMQSIVPKWG